MAELFSKEYLKDLLVSQSLEDAKKTTVMAGLESLSGRLARGGEAGSLADRILNEGDGLVRDVAQEAITQASSTLGNSDSNIHESKELFTQEYLKNLLESDNMIDLVSQKLEMGTPTDIALEQEKELPEKNG